MKMTVREVIERLEAVARGMDLGLDSPVTVMLCDGSGAEGSQEIEVDALRWISDDLTETRDFAVMIQGHPHLDRDKGHTTRFPGMANEADDALRKWTEGDEGVTGG